MMKRSSLLTRIRGWFSRREEPEVEQLLKPPHGRYPALSPARAALCDLVLERKRELRIVTAMRNAARYGVVEHPSFTEVSEMLRRHSHLRGILVDELIYFHCFDIYEYGKTYHVVGWWRDERYAMTHLLQPNPYQPQGLMPEMVEATQAVLNDWPKWRAVMRQRSGTLLTCAAVAALFGTLAVHTHLVHDWYAPEFGIGVAGALLALSAAALAFSRPWLKHRKLRAQIKSLYPQLRQERPEVPSTLHQEDPRDRQRLAALVEEIKAPPPVDLDSTAAAPPPQVSGLDAELFEPVDTQAPAEAAPPQAAEVLIFRPVDEQPENRKAAQSAA